MRSNIFDRLSFISLSLVIILLPVFFLPFTKISAEGTKGVLLVCGLTLSVIFWAIARFQDGKVVLPKSSLLVAGLGVVFALLISALFSNNSHVSLFGTMLDVGSFWFIFGAFILMLMSAITFRTSGQAKIVLLGTIVSSVAVLVFQSLHLFLPRILSLGILADKTSNVVGSWNALGLFAGFSALMFLLVIEFFSISKIQKILLSVCIVLSLLLAAAVNFPLVWILLGISGLIIFVYKASTNHEQSEGEISEERTDGKKHFPVISFIVVIISLLFFMSGPFIGSLITDRLQISNTEVGPSFSTTLSIGKKVLREHLVVGVGPNRFGEAWAMHKPQSVNATQFWNVSFDSGSGLLPTVIATTGLIGILAWLVFFVLFLVIGVKSVFSAIRNSVNWEMMAFFILSLYLFISSFFYSVGVVIFLLAFACTGVFVGLAASASKKEITVSFLNDHRKSFFSILILIALVIFSVSLSFKYLERFISVAYFGKALRATTVPIAEDSIGKALSLYSNDLYLRTYAEIHLVKLNSLVSKGSQLSEEEKGQLQAIVDEAVKGAQMAAMYNPSNYLNFQILGSVYQTVGALGVKDAYKQAVLSYQNASRLNPQNPGLQLLTANALFLDGKKEDAKTYAAQALTLKPDYTEAKNFLNQINSSSPAPVPVSPTPNNSTE